MKLHFSKPNNLARLHQEILTAIPDLGATKDREPIMRVEGLGEEIWITLPDDTPQTIINQINAIVVAHDPIPLQQPPTHEERLEALEMAVLTLMG